MSFPTLPTEIIERIIATTWSGALSTKERITFMTSSPLVSTSWAASFASISRSDVHITCAAHATAFLGRIADDFNANSSARSLTFHLTHVASMDVSVRVQNTIGEILSRTLYAITSGALLPNLRRVAIHYTNFGTDDVVRYTRLFVFPPQVTTLEVHYDFDAQCPFSSIARLHAQPPRDASVLDSLPKVQRLAVFGAGPGVVADLMNMCADATEVVTDVRVPQKITWFVPAGGEDNVLVYASGRKLLRSLLTESVARDEEKAGQF